MEYLELKTIHILSATLLFGTGLGSAFYKWSVDKTHNLEAMVITNKLVVLADWIFTTPSIILQAITGFILLSKLGYEFPADIINNSWLLLAIVLFSVAGLCWIPVVVIQIKMHKLAASALSCNTPLSDEYWRYSKIWFYLGIPAFIAMLIIFYLMSNKPVLY